MTTSTSNSSFSFNNSDDFRLITTEELKTAISMQEAIDLMAKAYSAFSSGESEVPLRYVTQLAEDWLTLLCKPAYLKEEERVGIKLLTQRAMQTLPEVPLIQGWMFLLDGRSGSLLSMMDGSWITALRTGAASGMATRLLARKDAQALALFGCGAQGATQLEAVSCVRDLKKVYLFDVDPQKVNQFIEREQPRYPFPLMDGKDRSVLKEADIVCTATGATSPLFRQEELQPGVHINAIGSFKPQMQEIDPGIVSMARIYTDSSKACLKESGDLLIPLQTGVIEEGHIRGEIGELILKNIQGRTSNDQTTLFKSVGIAIQDLVVANYAYDKLK